MIVLAAGDTIAGGADAASKVTCTMFGMERNAGVEVFKTLYQGQLASSPATIYTAPGSTEAFVKTIELVNADTSVARTCQLFRGGTAAANAITPLWRMQRGSMGCFESRQGWNFYDNEGQRLRAAGGSLSTYDTWAPTGYSFETIDRNICTETNTSLLASGTMSLVAIWLPIGTVVSVIAFWSATTAANTPTHQLFGLYDRNLNLCATSADATSAAWAANTKKELAMAAAFTTQYTGVHYLAIMVTATAVPTLKGNTARTSGTLAAAISSSMSMGGRSTGSLTTTIPALAAAPTTVTTTAWGAVG